jgi:hypothetical protein
VRDFITARKEQIVFYNSVHSYSQLILLPWGYTTTQPADYDELYQLAMKGSDALTATHGKVYEVRSGISSLRYMHEVAERVKINIL